MRQEFVRIFISPVNLQFLQPIFTQSVFRHLFIDTPRNLQLGNRTIYSGLSSMKFAYFISRKCPMYPVWYRNTFFTFFFPRIIILLAFNTMHLSPYKFTNILNYVLFLNLCLKIFTRFVQFHLKVGLCFPTKQDAIL